MTVSFCTHNKQIYDFKFQGSSCNGSVNQIRKYLETAKSVIFITISAETDIPIQMSLKFDKKQYILTGALYFSEKTKQYITITPRKLLRPTKTETCFFFSSDTIFSYNVNSHLNDDFKLQAALYVDENVWNKKIANENFRSPKLNNTGQIYQFFAPTVILLLQEATNDQKNKIKNKMKNDLSFKKLMKIFGFIDKYTEGSKKIDIQERAIESTKLFSVLSEEIINLMKSTEILEHSFGDLYRRTYSQACSKCDKFKTQPIYYSDKFTSLSIDSNVSIKQFMKSCDEKIFFNYSFLSKISKSRTEIFDFLKLISNNYFIDNHVLKLKKELDGIDGEFTVNSKIIYNNDESNGSVQKISEDFISGVSVGDVLLLEKSKQYLTIFMMHKTKVDVDAKIKTLVSNENVESYDIIKINEKFYSHKILVYSNPKKSIKFDPTVFSKFEKGNLVLKTRDGFILPWDISSNDIILEQTFSRNNSNYLYNKYIENTKSKLLREDQIKFPIPVCLYAADNINLCFKTNQLSSDIQLKNDFYEYETSKWIECNSLNVVKAVISSYKSVKYDPTLEFDIIEKNGIFSNYEKTGETYNCIALRGAHWYQPKSEISSEFEVVSHLRKFTLYGDEQMIHPVEINLNVELKESKIDLKESKLLNNVEKMNKDLYVKVLLNFHKNKITSIKILLSSLSDLNTKDTITSYIETNVKFFTENNSNVVEKLIMEGKKTLTLLCKIQKVCSIEGKDTIIASLEKIKESSKLIEKFEINIENPSLCKFFEVTTEEEMKKLSPYSITPAHLLIKEGDIYKVRDFEAPFVKCKDTEAEEVLIKEIVNKFVSNFNDSFVKPIIIKDGEKFYVFHPFSELFIQKREDISEVDDKTSGSKLLKLLDRYSTKFFIRENTIKTMNFKNQEEPLLFCIYKPDNMKYFKSHDLKESGTYVNIKSKNLQIHSLRKRSYNGFYGDPEKVESKYINQESYNLEHLSKTILDYEYFNERKLILNMHKNSLIQLNENTKLLKFILSTSDVLEKNFFVCIVLNKLFVSSKKFNLNSPTLVVSGDIQNKEFENSTIYAYSLGLESNDLKEDPNKEVLQKMRNGESFKLLDLNVQSNEKESSFEFMIDLNSNIVKISWKSIEFEELIKVKMKMTDETITFPKKCSNFEY